MESISLHLKITVLMLVLQLLEAFLTINMLKDILVHVTMEEHNMLIISKLCAKKEHLNSLTLVHKNGELMFKHSQDLQQTLQFIPAFLTHTIG